ncbi:uncharacterized [Tachysurus ichikawai]
MTPGGASGVPRWAPDIDCHSKALRRMAFYFPKLHETLRNHKGPISPEEAVVSLLQSRRVRIDSQHQWAGGTAFTSRPLFSVICVTIHFD